MSFDYDDDLRIPEMAEDLTTNDAAWKRIQQNTFTRWCNEHLKCVNLYIYSLETDLADGLKLIALLQVLAHKKVGKYNKKPSFRPQKLENISIALKFIEDENIKLVNIDATDIWKGNLKLILGLIWTLILKYQISIPMMDDDFDGEATKTTPKQALMGWVKSKLPPEIEVNNFNKDWNDGIAIASLVESSAPGLFPEWEDLVPENALENAKEAMKRAEDWLGVPQVITPEEITDPKVDELSVMTYVSYFPEAKCKPGAPLKPKMNDASKAFATGPGIEEHGVVVNRPADFTVKTTGSSRGKLGVQVFGPGRKQIDCMVQDNHDNTYSCQYIAPKVGTYDVHIRIGGHHIPKSPFRVNVASDLDTSKVLAKGPGLEPHGVVVGRAAKFEVFATGAGSGDLVIDVIDPKGNKKTELKIEDKGDNVYHCEYMPTMVGRYVIVIKYGGKEISRSPFHVNVTPAAAKVKIFGPGLEPGLKTGKPASFTVDCAAVGDGSLDVSIEGPGKSDVKCDIKDNGDGTFTCTYKPTRPGTYVIAVKFDNGQVPKSPVKVNVGSTVDLSKVKAWGPGLERGVSGKPCNFSVSCKGATLDNLSVGVEGPAEAKVEVKDQGNGTCEVTYFPTKPGSYTIHVMYDEMDIKESPFNPTISPPGDITKVYADGPGLKPGTMADMPAEFTVFCQKAGAKCSPTDVEVDCIDETGNKVECHVTDNGNNTFKVIYFPKLANKHKIYVRFQGEEIPESPITVPVQPFCDPTKVKANGPGLSGGKAEKPAKFKIDASKAGDGGIGLTIEGPSEAEIKCDDHGDGTCSVEYFPIDEGEYSINILFADQHIPGSPFKPIISSDSDATKVKAGGPGLEPGCKAGKPADIGIDTRRAGKGKLVIEACDNSGNPVKVNITEEEPGLFASSYYPNKEGPHTVSIMYGGKHIPKSPFRVNISPAADASKVKVSGPGIDPINVRSLEPTYFEVDASEAGDGNVDINIEPVASGMPKVKDIDVKEGKKPNSYVVSYIAPKEGDYVITVTFAGQNVPKSPIKIKVKPGVDMSKIKVIGPGIEEPIVGRENSFAVECPPEAKDQQLTCEIETPTGKKIKANVSDKGNGVFDVVWTPSEPGRHKIIIKLGGEEVPGSPFYVDVLEVPDPAKVKCYGPGLENAYVKQGNNFTIETKNAGPGNLGLTIEGPDEAKIDCKDNGDGTCSVVYTPFQPGDYDVNIKFDNIHVPGSPFKVNAITPVDASKVKVKGDGIKKKIQASYPTEFVVDATEAGEAPLEVDIIGPNEKSYPCDVKSNGDGTFNCAYVPERAGPYKITPRYGGNDVPNAPFRVNAEPVGDASKVKVSGPGVKRPHVGHPAPFDIDCSKAGDGNLNLSARGPNGEPINVQVLEEIAEGVFACAFTPEQLGPHELDVLFGGEPVRGSSFKMNAEPEPDLDKVKTPMLEDLLNSGPCVDQLMEGPVDVSEVPDHEGAFLTAKITTPSGKKSPCDVKDNHDGTFALNYTPKEVGRYVLEVSYDGIPIPGSPFEFEVTEGGPDKVKVYGKGIKKGIVAIPSRFTVDTKNAGPGDLSVAVEGPSKVDIECIDNGDGTCEVTYVPVEPGDYDVIVKFDNKPVPGSPFKAKVVQDEPAVEVGRPSDLCMLDELSSNDLPKLKGLLEAPSGKETPVEVAEGPNDTVIASFIPEEPGKNLLHLMKSNNPVKGSPVPLMVRQKPEIGKNSQVPIETPDCNIPDDLKNMRGVLTRPNGKEEPCNVEEAPDSTVAISFIPEEPGKHLIKVLKNNKQIEDSPFVVVVEGSPDQYPKVGQPCNRNFYQPEPVHGSDTNKMKGMLRRPSGREEPIDVKLGPDGTVECSFIPLEAGEHLVSVKKEGHHITNSPFSIMVIDEPAVPTVGNECAANFDIPELDLPKDLKDLTGALKRPNGKEEPLVLGVSDGSLAVNFVPKESGRHEVSIKKKGKHVKDSPFVIMVEDAKPDGPTVGHDCNANLDIPELDLPNDLKVLKGELERPSGKKELLDLECGPDKTLGLCFVPKESGPHKVHVAKNGKPCKGSPYIINVDETKTKGPDVGRECGVNLDIPELNLPRDLKNVEAELIRPSGKREPLKCENGPEETLGINFTPTEPGKHLIDVKKKGKPVKGSPFEVDVSPFDKGPGNDDIISPVDLRGVESAPDFTEGPGKGGPTVGSPCDVNLDIEDFKPEELNQVQAVLTHPSGKKEPVDVTLNIDESLAIGFIPVEVGRHLLDVTKRGKPVKGSPFEIIVEEKDPSKPTVGNKCDMDFDIPDVVLPDDLPYLKGTLKRPNGIQEPVVCTVTPENTLGLEFTPKEPGKHTVDVTKKGKPVQGSPFVVVVEEEPQTSKAPTVGNECDVSLDIPGIRPEDFKKLVGILKRPNSRTEEPLEITHQPDNAIGVHFVPNSPGLHKIIIKKDGKPVHGSPFEVLVEDYPKQVQEPHVGSPCDITLDLCVTEEEFRALTGTLMRPGKKEEEPLDLRRDKNGHIVINFIPKEVGVHKISIRSSGKHVSGSPIEVMVSSGKKKPTCDVGFEIPGIKLPEDLKYLKGYCVSPSGKEELVELQPGPKNTIVVSFIPKEAGTYYIHINKQGKAVSGSPFEVNVKPEDIAVSEADASKVKCSGKGLKSGIPSQKCEFTVDTRDAGYGGLGMSIEGPSKVEINCIDNEDGTCAVNFSPTEPGVYLINIQYGDEHVPGSPFKCHIGDGRFPVDEEITMITDNDVQSFNVDETSDILAFPSSKTQAPQDFVIKFSGSGDLMASVTRPSGIEDPAEVVETGPDTYTVRFVPRETGEHLVNVKARRRHIPGSPFKVLVEAPAGGAAACHARGSGLDGGIACQPCRFTVVTRDAGPGGLAVAVEGPAKAEIQCHDNGDGSCDITWYPVEPGEYTVHIRFADEAIPNSPYKVLILPESDGQAMSMESFKDQVLRVGQQASFAVQMKGKIGKITSSVRSPSNEKIDCTAVELEEGSYAVRFIPRELGDHLVSVFLDGHHIPGSPFTVKVGGLEGDPSKVTASGPGLKGGMEGRPAEFMVDALDAGSGALALSIDGPAKVKMNCVEQDDGTYKVIYNPTVPGVYEISIRFAGQHIPSSPYKVRIIKPDNDADASTGNASKCESTGSGLHHALVGQSASFTINASNAGRGSLMVGVEGPAIPAKEIVIRHTGNKVYSVNYILEEEGDYILKILWADNHIPGSPFHVVV